MFLIPENYWKVQKTSLKGRGVFAQKDIDPGRVIGDYQGQIVNINKSSLKEKNYLMHSNDHSAILPPINSVGIHLINHSCAPNCGIYMYQSHALYFALRRIFKGEELTVCYLNGAPDTKDLAYEAVCHCGAPVCRGTTYNSEFLNNKMDEFYKHIEGIYFEKTPGRIGDFIKSLATYPLEIPDYPVFDIFGSVINTSLLIDEKRMPELKKLRKLIRESGRQLKLLSIGIEVYGIMNGLIISRYATTSNS